MENLILFIFLVSLVLWPVSMIAPNRFERFFGTSNRKNLSLIFGGALLASFILFGVVAEPVEEPTPSALTEQEDAVDVVQDAPAGEHEEEREGQEEATKGHMLVKNRLSYRKSRRVKMALRNLKKNRGKIMEQLKWRRLSTVTRSVCIRTAGWKPCD